MKKKIKAIVSAILLSLILATSGILPSSTRDTEAAVSKATITACHINPDGTSISVAIHAPKAPTSDDGIFYLLEEPTYSGGITGNYVATAPIAETAVFSFALNARQADSKLYSKFVAAVLQGGQLVAVSEPCYITNPEAIATSTTPRTATASKKGLLVDPAKLTGSELTDLGVKHAIYNIPISNILGATSNNSYPTINYNYNGKSYQFNGLVVAEYDHVFKLLSGKGISVTAVLLNNFTGANPHLLHPYARDGVPAAYYAFNAAEPAGVEHLAAIGSFLGQRYSNKGHGKVDNWVIGNEVTARSQWNYMQYVDVNTYAEEYAKAVRLFYTAIKSENGSANIYVSIDQQWDRNRNDPNNYDGKDLLAAFNRSVSSKGNIDWGVACHPYPVPLTWAPFWMNTAYYSNLVQHRETSPFLTMENIEVLTDYMTKPEMLSPYGQVRSVIASEIGYTAAQGEDVQAAAFVQGYLAAANNQHIDAFLVSRQTDSYEEIAQGLSMGLTNPDGSHKLIYEYYKNIDTGNAAAYTEAAKAKIGIADWSQVISPR